jgi:glycosyltransferase involved in cell wall biosynthesis
LSVLDSRRDSRARVSLLGAGTSNTDTTEQRRADWYPSVSVVIPALNEAENLPHVLATLPENIFELVLVDGNSLDGTATVARELYPLVRIVGQPGRGKGDALAAGFAVCSGDIIVMMDADGSTDGSEIPRFVEALAGGADFAKGSRFVADGGSEDITPLRLAGNRFLCGLVNRLFRTSYTDLCYGYNAFWRRVLPAISPDCHGFEVETMINIRAAVAGLQIVEVASVERARIHGQSKLRPVRDGFRVLKTILGEWRRDHRREELVPVDPVSAESSGIV